MTAMGKIQFATVDGVSIRYIRNDEGSGTPILLTSPWPESILAFHAIWPDMKKLGPLLAVDLPGFGLSGSRDDLLTPSAMGDFVIRLADAFRLTRVHAIGPDIGTAAMLFAASRKPELFESIVVGSGGTDMELVGQGLRDLINMPAKDIDGGEEGEHVVANVKRLAKRPVPQAQLDDYGRASAHGRYATAAKYVRAYPTDLPRLQKLLSAIQTPTLVISGSEDPIVPPANGDLLQMMMPRCRAEVVKSGHFVWEDASETYARLVSEWVRGGYRAV